MKIIFIAALVALFAYAQAISFSEGTNFYVPVQGAVLKYSSSLNAVSSVMVPSANQVQTTYDGVVDRLNTFLFLFSGSDSNWYITKIDLATFTVSQTASYPRKAVHGSVMADNDFVYWLDNVPGNENTTWVRVGKNNINAEPESISLIGSVVAVGPRPDPRDGFNSEVDLVAYFVGPRGILQRTSTAAFNVITPIPVPEDQVIIHVQNGLAYDLTMSGNDKIVRSYTFLPSALNATGSSTVITSQSNDIPAPLQEDRYNRGFFHTVLYKTGEEKRYIRHVDGTLERKNQPWVLEKSQNADALPRVDNNALHYTADGVIYVYDVRTGACTKVSIQVPTTEAPVEATCPPCPCGSYEGKRRTGCAVCKPCTTTTTEPPVEATCPPCPCGSVAGKRRNGCAVCLECTTTAAPTTSEPPVQATCPACPCGSYEGKGKRRNGCPACKPCTSAAASTTTEAPVQGTTTTSTPSETAQISGNNNARANDNGVAQVFVAVSAVLLIAAIAVLMF